MKQYIKDGITYPKPQIIYLEESTVINPSDEILLKAGYEIVEINHEITNEDIEIQRAKEYKLKADDLFTAYQAYKELGEEEKAEKMRLRWIEVRKQINEENPYLDENEPITDLGEQK
jgi:hypothetical protein